MKFTDSQLKDIMSKIDSKCGDFKCPICGTKDLAIDPNCVYLASYEETANEVNIGIAALQRCASYTCQHCKYTMLFQVEI